MIARLLLKTGTGLLGVLLLVVIAIGITRQRRHDAVMQQRREGEVASPPILGSDASVPDRSDQSPAIDDVQTSTAADQLAAAGVIGSAVPLSELHRVELASFRSPLVKRLYVEARSRGSRLLAVGTPTQTVRPYQSDQAMSLGRHSAISIELELDEEIRDKMPGITLSQTLDYLDRHRLVIQVEIFSNELGDVYFGTDCRAAFIDRSTPAVSIAAEPMIVTSVAGFRTLGLLDEPDGPIAAGQAGAGDSGRTLVMAFRYVQSADLISDTAGRQNLVELLLLHLREDATARRPKFDVFATTGDLQTLHRLKSMDDPLTDSPPSIRAKIRFDKFVMMGLYPAAPVVVDFELSSDREVATATLQALMKGSAAKNAMPLAQILDRFDQVAGSR